MDETIIPICPFHCIPHTLYFISTLLGAYTYACCVLILLVPSHLRYIFNCLQDGVVQKWPTDDTVRTRAVRYMYMLVCCFAIGKWSKLTCRSFQMGGFSIMGQPYIRHTRMCTLISCMLAPLAKCSMYIVSYTCD